MAHIRIVEKANGDGFAVRVAMGDEGEFEAAVKPPFEAGDELKLEWYFEEYLRYPFAYEAGEGSGRERQGIWREPVQTAFCGHQRASDL